MAPKAKFRARAEHTARAAEASAGSAFSPPASASLTRRVEDPSSPAKRQKGTTTPICCCIYAYGDSAADLGFHNVPTDAKVWQIQLQQDDYNSALKPFKTKFEQYLAFQHARDDSWPATLSDLAEKDAVRVRLSGEGDDYDVGFQPWRTAVYVAGQEGDLTNAMWLLDAYWAFADQRRDEWKLEALTVAVYYQSQVPLASFCETPEKAFSGYSIAPPRRHLPLPIFAAYPPWRTKPLCLILEIISPAIVTLMWGGDTYHYGERFDALSIRGGKDAAGRYWRTHENIDVTDEAMVAEVRRIFQETLCNIVQHVRVHGEIPEDSAVGVFLAQLKAECIQLHFSVAA